MEVKLERKYDFLKHKYNELILPTCFMVMSEKIATILDVLIIAMLLGSTQLAAINLTAPITYATGIFYVLFGQGGSLLALRAKSQLKHEKANFYFTLSIIGICLVSLIFVLLIFLFADNILIYLNTPAEIFNVSKDYLSMLMFFYPLNCYILVISFFIRADGFPKIPFYAVMMANIFNIFFDIIFLKVFNLGIAYTALGSVLGYLVGAIYISNYLIKKQSNFRLISLAKFKVKEIFLSLKEIVINTPDVIAKIFFVLKMSFLTYLCSTYWGVAGLLAFLIYDNSETFVYMFLSGIMKTMSPIVTVLYKEMDFEAVQYIISHSFKHLVLISFPISAILFVFPEILLLIFNVTDPYNAKIVILAIRITAFSLMGRCISYLMANYAQAIEQNKIAFNLLFLEEFLFAIMGALILTKIMGGIGIWISILVAESVPVLIYVVYTIYIQKQNKDKINSFLMLQNSNLITLTYNRKDKRITEKYLDEEYGKILFHIKNVFKEDTSFISNSIGSICKNIFENTDVQDIDITIRLIEEDLYIVLTSEGTLYNPFSNENLMKSDAMNALSKLNCKLEYDEILGFNKTYVIFNN